MRASDAEPKPLPTPPAEKGRTSPSKRPWRRPALVRVPIRQTLSLSQDFN